MALNNKILKIVVFTFFIVIAFIVNFNKPYELEKPIITKTMVETCDIQSNVCQVKINNATIKVSVEKNIYYLKPFEFFVEIENAENFKIESIYVDFKMKNMNMGVNRFKLKAKDINSWQGKALLPICVTGRADWFAEVDILVRETQYRLVFPIFVQKTKR